MNRFASNLRNLREDCRVRQEDLAKSIGTTKGAISLWENMKRDPSMNCLIKIADYFNITLDELVGREFHRIDNIIKF